jgi:hypothetical protein
LSLLLLPFASRPKAKAFDGLGTLDLVKGYARMLAGLFEREPDLGLSPPGFLLRLLGLRRSDLGDEALAATSIEAAERSVRREDVQVTAL